MLAAIALEISKGDADSTLMERAILLGIKLNKNLKFLTEKRVINQKCNTLCDTIYTYSSILLNPWGFAL